MVGDARVTINAVRNVRQTMLHMLVRWKPGIHWVVKQIIAMARQKSEIELETVGTDEGDSRRRYIMGLPRER